MEHAGAGVTQGDPIMLDNEAARSMEELARILRELYALVAQLTKMFRDRPFTPDGHMVGSIGEAWAKLIYDLELLPPSTPVHDAKALEDGRLVQIKASQGRSVGLSAEPVHLLVLQLRPDGTSEEVYNGPGKPVWEAAGKVSKTSQRPISLAALKKLMTTIPMDARLPVKRMLSLEPTDACGVVQRVVPDP